MTQVMTSMTAFSLLQEFLSVAQQRRHEWWPPLQHLHVLQELLSVMWCKRGICKVLTPNVSLKCTAMMQVMTFVTASSCGALKPYLPAAKKQRWHLQTSALTSVTEFSAVFVYNSVSNTAWPKWQHFLSVTQEQYDNGMTSVTAFSVSVTLR